GPWARLRVSPGSAEASRSPREKTGNKDRPPVGSVPRNPEEVAMSELMIQVENLIKDYGPTRAVDRVTFNVRKGEVLGFLGPNGAGKSTTMKMLTCFLAPTGGRAKVAGYDVFDDSLEVRKRIGYLPEDTPIYRDMTVMEFLRFVASVRGMTGTT